MRQDPIYLQITEAIRQDIQTGRLKPSDRLPPLRQLTAFWGCTPGTVQHAYQELARQGLVSCRPGQGTHVLDQQHKHQTAPLRKAALLHRAESFFLETLSLGYDAREVDAALQLALDRFQVISSEPAAAAQGTLRFAGSHDPALAWLAAHFSEIVPDYSLQIQFSTSLGGLIALSEGNADLAGSHLWDSDTNSYNAPYVKKLLPGRRVALITLAERRLGLMVPPGNPRGIFGIADLAAPGLRFANRQAGSGTRVWLDIAMRNAHVSTVAVMGYQDRKNTHTEVAAAVAEGFADAGFGLLTAALSFGLDFIDLVREPYSLVIPEESWALGPVTRLADWLASPEAHQAINRLGGYDTSLTGSITWVESG